MRELIGSFYLIGCSSWLISHLSVVSFPTNDIIDLQETRRSGQSALLQGGYADYCSDESVGDGQGKKGQGEVGLAVREIRVPPVPKHDRRSSSATGD